MTRAHSFDPSNVERAVADIANDLRPLLVELAVSVIPPGTAIADTGFIDVAARKVAEALVDAALAQLEICRQEWLQIGEVQP